MQRMRAGEVRDRGPEELRLVPSRQVQERGGAAGLRALAAVM